MSSSASLLNPRFQSSAQLNLESKFKPFLGSSKFLGSRFGLEISERSSDLKIRNLKVLADGGQGIDVKESSKLPNSAQLAADAAAALSIEENQKLHSNSGEISQITSKYSLDELKALESRVIVQTYARAPVAFVSGKGSKLYDIDGKEYIDLSGGIAVNVLGHSDPDWVEAVTSQANQLAHVSNLYYTIPQILLAERIVNSSFADKAFFTNSGTEANEAAIKFARKYQLTKFKKQNEKKGLFSFGPNQPATEFVAFSNCFHGRTIGALSLTSKEQYRTPFEPLMPGVTFAEYGDLKSAEKAVKKGRTAAVFVEPLQGEGGVNVSTSEFLRGLRKLCDESGALLIFDEVQCGLGRTGNLWAHEPYGIVPDIMTLAKPLAGGLPIGMVLTNDDVASAIAYGDHGSTFAGAPLVCQVALTVLQRIQEPGFLENVAAKGNRMRKLLHEKIGNNPHVKEIRGRGLLIGIQLDVPAGPLVDAARKEGVLVITAGKGDVVRLAPPLIITDAELAAAADVLAKCMPVLG